MSYNKYLSRIESLDMLIRMQATGTPSECAQKLNISESTLYDLIAFLKKRGAPICYSRISRSYRYYYPVRFRFCFEEDAFRDIGSDSQH